MQIQLGDITIDIISVGGHYTSIQLPNQKIAIDMGICTPVGLRCNHVFFTHAHTDHIAGVIRHCSTREMMNMPTPTYVIGEEHRAAFDDVFRAWRKLNRSFMKCNVKTMRPKETMKISQKWGIEAFRSMHRMPCQGYLLYEERKKLLPKYHGLPQKEIAELAKQKVQIIERKKIPLLAYTGDTTIDVLYRESWLRQVKILLLEVTFFDEKVSPEMSKKHGHIHIDDIPQQPDFFQNEHVVILHLSSRYSTEQVEDIIQEKLPQYLQDKITLIPNHFDSIFE